MYRATRRPDATLHPACGRCGVRINKPRPNAMCMDCRDVTRFEETAARRGVDLAGLSESEFVVLGHNGTRIVDEMEDAA